LVARSGNVLYDGRWAAGGGGRFFNRERVVNDAKAELRNLIRTMLIPRIEALVESLPDGLKDVREAEKLLRDGMLDIAGLMLQAWSDKADKAGERPSCGECARPMRHCGNQPIKVATTIGDVSIRRPRWRCEDCRTEVHPLDEFVRFGVHGVSWALAEVISRMGAQGPFEQARRNLRADYGAKLCKQTVERVVEDAGAKVLEAEDALRDAVAGRAVPLPQTARADIEPEAVDTVVVSADGTMIHAEGDWKEIKVAGATAYSQGGVELGRTVRARFLDVDEFAWTLVMAAREVGIQHAKRRAFVADGALWLWKLADSHFPNSTQILDWYHLSEHVHAAAAALHGAESVKAKEWAKHRLDLLWNGGAEKCIDGVKRQHESMDTPAKREALRELLVYLEHNKERVNYPEYRRQRLPCGSGPIEAQCKTLVGQRCKMSGMRNWKKAGAECVLRLRAADQNGEHADLWARRLAPAA